MLRCQSREPRKVLIVAVPAERFIGIQWKTALGYPYVHMQTHKHTHMHKSMHQHIQLHAHIHVYKAYAQTWVTHVHIYQMFCGILIFANANFTTVFSKFLREQKLPKNPKIFGKRCFVCGCSRANQHCGKNAAMSKTLINF